MISIYTGTMLLSAFLAAVSQLFLKLSARNTYKAKIYEYLNVKVIVGYGLLFLTLVLNTWAYQGVAYKIGPAINATSYVFVMLLGHFFLHEKITVRKILGVCLIVMGIIISTMGGNV